MSTVAIHLTIEPGSGPASQPERVSDPAMLRQVARVAIHEAHQKGSSGFYSGM